MPIAHQISAPKTQRSSHEMGRTCSLKKPMEQTIVDPCIYSSPKATRAGDGGLRSGEE